jgi:hypothetical protein
MRRGAGFGQTGVAAILMLALAGCGLPPSGPPVIRADAETFPWTDVSQYRTYRWWQPAPRADQGLTEREMLIDWYIRSSVDRELAARGYAPDTRGTPDFVVRYEVGLHEGSTSSFQDYLQYRADGGKKDMGEAFMGYDVGTLVVSLVDVASRRVAWRGRASAVIERDTRGKLIDPAVRQMMVKLPEARHR